MLIKKQQGLFKWSDYILVFILIAISGFPWTKVIPGIYYFSALFCVLHALSNNNIKLLQNKPLLLFISFYFIVYIVHNYHFQGNVNTKIYVDVCIRIFIAAYIGIALNNKFRFVYLDIMTVFSIISFVFFPLQLLGFVFDVVGDSYFRDILIYSTRPDPYHSGWEVRNSGPFWEPGAFGGYILLLLVLFFDDLNYLFKEKRTHIWVIIIAIITTFSTMTYCVTALLIFFYFLSKRKLSSLSFFVFILFSVFLYMLFNNLDFISNKINNQFELALIDQANEVYRNTRFGSFFFDLGFILKNPLFGNGYMPETRYAGFPEIILMLKNGESLGDGNGFSDFMASNGIIFFLFWLFLIYRNLRNTLNPRSCFLCLIIIILILNGERFFSYALIWGLPFYSIRKICH